ncbi:MAG TPA: hypothetical protein VGP37_01535 [Candidatus Nanopelagicales bacterium]|nr:hypothetical protein [Candidatus Nanopelagicales bacterium]
MDDPIESPRTVYDASEDAIGDVSLSDEELTDIAGGRGAGTSDTEFQWARNRRGLPPSMGEPR